MRARIVKTVLGAAIAVGAVPALASAATITPDTFLDDNANNGNCTLREAVIAANTDAADDACTAGTGADEIPLQAGTYTLSLPGAPEEAAATGDLDITDPDGLKITGDPAGSTLDANGIDRVLQLLAGAQASIDLMTITGGNDGSGGGIRLTGGSTANVSRTALTGNAAVSEGGGIDLIGAGSTLNLTDSTLWGNTATDDGGALAFQADTTVNMTDSTLSGNAALGTGSPPNQGGAVEAEPGGVGNFLSSTITNNTAPSQGGISQQGNATINLKGTILAGNSVTGAAPECDAVTSQGHNLIQDTIGCTITNQQPTDITGQNPQLGLLADNGGPTLTHALLTGSPAIDAGPPDAPPTDQRGAPRNPDIGAYELVTCLGVIVNRVGTAAGETLTGTEASDGFLLLGGDDTATGLGGNDAFCGAEGNDSFDGGDGDDGGSGGEGDDTALGLAGNDTWSGDAGNDFFDGGDGNDVANGGDGNDQLEGLAGKDKLKGANGNDKLKGGNGSDRLNGGKGKDKLNGGKSKDTCKGAAGKDRGKSCEKEKQIP